METGRKFRATPDDDLARTLAGWIGCVRAVCNRKAESERYLEWLREHSLFSPSWHATGGLPADASPFVCNQSYSPQKGDRTTEPWFYEVPAQLYRNAMYQRSQGWLRFFENPQEVSPPGNRRRGINDSILLTKELFRWLGNGRVELGTKAHPVGILPFRQHRAAGEPNSLTIARDSAGRWWLSFNFDDGVAAIPPEVILAGLATKTDEEIVAAVSAHDVGIVQSVTCSDGTIHRFDARKLAQIQRWKRRISRLQQKLARQKNKASRRRGKTKRKIALTHSRIAALRNDHAHQVSHRVIEHSPATVHVFEALNLRGMVRRAKPVQDEDGQYLPNGVAAKSGLNAAILNQGWGKIVKYARYKAQRAGKLVVTVDPRHTSQECSCCGHTSPANRPTQAEFHCQACGFTANADANASAVSKQRAVALLLRVLGRRTDITPGEAAKQLGLDSSLAAEEPGINSRKGSPRLAA